MEACHRGWVYLMSSVTVAVSTSVVAGRHVYMPLFDHVLHPGSAHGLARLQTRLLRAL